MNLAPMHQKAQTKKKPKKKKKNKKLKNLDLSAEKRLQCLL